MCLTEEKRLLKYLKMRTISGEVGDVVTALDYVRNINLYVFDKHDK